MSKGSKRRPQCVKPAKMSENWLRTFHVEPDSDKMSDSGPDKVAERKVDTG